MKEKLHFNFIQQKFPTSVSGETNECWYSIQRSSIKSGRKYAKAYLISPGFSTIAPVSGR
ncbi:hypothetical protein [Siminovitchia terrae]|uniref:hypothetical protein n=1 Tax=Siminovitchia terrae TaxID=1914933 RepID=UPI001BB3CB87|nr:hypothetical protein [Siminovitchia terrae]